MTRKNLLFLTSFSEPSYRAIPTIADWMDREHGRLTILHVHRPGRNQEERAREQLRSFYAEADRYSDCERLLLSGSLVPTIVDYCRREQPDVIFAPACAPTGLPRIGHRSLRASLLRKGGVRLWTRGWSRNSSNKAPKNVAYVVTGHEHWQQEAIEASEAAERHRARFHLIYLIPQPHIDEGTMPWDILSENPEAPASELHRLGARLAVQPTIHAAAGNAHRQLRRLLEECQADLVFAGESHATHNTLFGVALSPALQTLQGEMICLPARPYTPKSAVAVEEHALALRPAYDRVLPL